MTETIRLAVDSDLESISTCARLAYLVYVERIGREPSPMLADYARHVDAGHVFVIGDEMSIFGYVIFCQSNNHVHLKNIAVLPDYQGHGLGRKLIGFVESQARRWGCRAVDLYTNEKMLENLELYPKLGYEEIDRRCVDGFDRVFFRKAL